MTPVHSPRNFLLFYVLLICFSVRRGFVESGADGQSKGSDDERLEAAARQFETKILRGVEEAKQNLTAWREHLKRFEG